MPSVPKLNGQRSKRKPPPILYIVAYPILASAIAVWLSTQPNGGLTCTTDKPPSSHATAAGVNDELIHSPYTLDTSHRFADCMIEGTTGIGGMFFGTVAGCSLRGA